MRETMFGGEPHQLLGSLHEHRIVTAQLMKNTIDVQGERERIGLRQLARQSQRAPALCQRRIWISKQQKNPGDKTFAGHARIMWRKFRRSMPVTAIEGECLSEVTERA